jgi:hypothetical protein
MVGGEQARRRLATQYLKTNTNRKKTKNNKESTNREKAGKEPKAGKMAIGREPDPCRPDITVEGALEARHEGDA